MQTNQEVPTFGSYLTKMLYSPVYGTLVTAYSKAVLSFTSVNPSPVQVTPPGVGSRGTTFPFCWPCNSQGNIVNLDPEN